MARAVHRAFARPCTIDEKHIVTVTWHDAGPALIVEQARLTCPSLSRTLAFSEGSPVSYQQVRYPLLSQ